MDRDFVRVDSPLGCFTAEVVDGAVCRAGFDDWVTAPRDIPPARGAAPVRDALAAYFSGAVDALDELPVEAGGTRFQRRVWALLRDIPPGETRSYGELASALGSPGAARAVGMANASNPVALIVPCHRVVRTGGEIGGYAGGVERKRWLLDHEYRSKTAAVTTP